jgi:hypothetical protein
MKYIVVLKSACIATTVIAVVAACANNEENATLLPDGRQINLTSISPSFAATSSGGFGNHVDVKSLEWTRKVNDILASEVSSEQPISHLVCFFSVGKNGRILGTVKFSHPLDTALAKRMADKIMRSSPLPAVPGGKNRNIYFEIARHGDMCVGFAK